MAFRLDTPAAISLADIAWDDISDLQGSGTRLLAHIRIGGLDMHLEAREMTEDTGGQTTVEYPEDHERMCDIAGCAFQALMMNDRAYFVYALPFGT